MIPSFWIADQNLRIMDLLRCDTLNNGVKKFQSHWSKFDQRVGLARQSGPVPSMLHNNQTSQQLTLWFTNVTVLTLIELHHYKFWKWHNLQRSWNIENFLNREHEIQKGGPQIMTSWYDDVVPGMLPIFCLKSEVSLEHWGRSRSPVSCARNFADDEDLQLG